MAGDVRRDGPSFQPGRVGARLYSDSYIAIKIALQIFSFNQTHEEIAQTLKDACERGGYVVKSGSFHCRPTSASGLLIHDFLNKHRPCFSIPYLPNRRFNNVSRPFCRVWCRSSSSPTTTISSTGEARSIRDVGFWLLQ